MLDKLINLLKDVLTAVAAFAIGYIKAKNDATHANTQDENKKLADGLNTALGGNYTRDNAFDRMRNETGATMDDKTADTDKGDV